MRSMTLDVRFPILLHQYIIQELTLFLSTGNRPGKNGHSHKGLEINGGGPNGGTAQSGQTGSTQGGCVYNSSGGSSRTYCPPPQRGNRASNSRTNPDIEFPGLLGSDGGMFP